MDFQNRSGVRFGSGAGMSDAGTENAARRERLRKLALETIDLSKDPYFGSFECKLCLTVHMNEDSYLTHTQGKKHSTNLARRAAKDEKDSQMSSGVAPAVPVAQMTAQRQEMLMYSHMPIRKILVKIGRPGYKVTKIRDPLTLQSGLLFQLYYPDIVAGDKPHHRFMSAYEQRVEPPSKHFQYLLVAAEPYETVAFKVQSLEVDRSESKFWSYWDNDTKQYHLQFFFKG